MRLLILFVLALFIIACSTVQADTPDSPPAPTNLRVYAGENGYGFPSLTVMWGITAGDPPDTVLVEIHDRDGRTRGSGNTGSYNVSGPVHWLAVGGQYGQSSAGNLRLAGCYASETALLLTSDCLAKYNPGRVYGNFPPNFLQFAMDYTVRVKFFYRRYSPSTAYSPIKRVTMTRLNPEPTPTPAFAVQQYVPATPTPAPTATPWPTPTPKPWPTPTPVPQSQGAYKIHGVESSTAAGLGSATETWINQQSANGYRLHSIVPTARDRVLVVMTRR